MDARDIARLVRSEDLLHPRRGAYAEPSPAVVLPEALHRRLVEATVPQLEPGAVLSHATAAVLHSLPTWSEDLTHVHVTRDRSYGAKRRSVVRVHGATLRSEDVTMIDGIPVTTLTRTVLDLARRLPMDRSVAAGDRALAMGLTTPELHAALTDLTYWPGVRRARRVVDFLDGRSESAGESVSRLRMMLDGVPAPELQYEVFDDDGMLIGRSDFAWPELGTLGEFDGKVKYGRLLKPGQSVEQVVFEEKVREDAFRSRGHQVVRWLWADAYRPNVIRTRLFRAFERGTGRSWPR